MYFAMKNVHTAPAICKTKTQELQNLIEQGNTYM